MTPQIDRRALAEGWARDLPPRIRAYLNSRGIPDALIERHLLGWNGERITIPIPGPDGCIAFFKFRKDPEDVSESPKFLASSGSSIELYGYDTLSRNPRQLVICEGEFDRLVLEAQGFDAVTSTGGALSFREDWVSLVGDIPEIYVVFDGDDAGREGARKVARLVPHARIVTLPEEVGDGGDVTDLFARLGHTPSEFEALLAAARPLPTPPEPPRGLPRVTYQASREHIDQVKAAVRIEEVIRRSVELRLSGGTFAGHCLFHDDRHPSLVVFPSTQTFHCFACRAGGDVISFFMLKDRLSFPEALRVVESLTP